MHQAGGWNVCNYRCGWIMKQKPHIKPWAALHIWLGPQKKKKKRGGWHRYPGVCVTDDILDCDRYASSHAPHAAAHGNGAGDGTSATDAADAAPGA